MIAQSEEQSTHGIASTCFHVGNIALGIAVMWFRDHNYFGTALEIYKSCIDQLDYEAFFKGVVKSLSSNATACSMPDTLQVMDVATNDGENVQDIPHV